MCIVIDINTLASVFNVKSKRHKEFSPVKRWIEERRGVVVYGGTTYKEELKKTFRYYKLIRIMRDGGRAVSIRDNIVDTIETEIRKKTRSTDCNDQHIIALLCASRCSLLCSDDKKSFKFVRDRKLYPKGMSKISVYRSSKDTGLLVTMSKSSLTNVI